MRPDTPITTSAGVLAAMTAEQFSALQQNILAEGLWETVTEAVHISGTDYLGVHMPDGLFIGIEKDGHTHS